MRRGLGISNPGKFTNIGPRTPCGWSGTTRTPCPGTGSSHGTYRVSYCGKTGQDVYVIQVGNNKTVERDHTELLPREPDPHCRAVTFEFTAEAFDSDNDG